MSIAARIRAAVLAAALLAVGAGAAAQAPANVCARPAADTAGEALTRLSRLQTVGCLGGSRCQTALCKSVATFEARWKDKPVTEITYREARSLFEDIRASAETLPASHLAAPELQRMFAAWSPALGGPGTLSVERLRTLETMQWQPESGDLRLFARSPNAEIVLKDQFEQRCATGAAACTAALAQAAEVIEHSLLVHRVLTVALDADAILAPYFERLRKRWAAYNNESRAIYPWELAANARLLKGPTEGFVEPPDRQLLLLHPGAGMTYKPSRGNEESELRGVITVDLVGLYRWRWGGADGTQITSTSGWSVAAGWDGRRVGYGLGFHFADNRSLYLMRDKDGRTMLVVSLDLGNYLRDKEASVRDLGERIRALR